MDNVNISVIMPVYNSEKYLNKSIESVLGQSYKDFELILVDDGSTDSSGKICDEYAVSDTRIKVIHQANGGVSKARNTGIARSVGKYILFLDSDDEMDQNLMEENFKIIEKLDPDILIFNFRYVFPDHTTENGFKQNKLFFGDNRKFFDEKLEKVVENELMNAPWNKIIRKEMIQNNNLHFDERFSILEDAMFSISACTVANSICVNSNIYHSYNIWGSGSLRTKWSENRFEAIKELYKLERRYCGKYENNKQQTSFFGKIFCKSLFAYMQLTSVTPDLTYKKRKEVIKSVCNDIKVRQVFLNKKYKSTYGMNKRIIRFLVKMKMPRIVIMLYRIKHSCYN